MSRSSWVAVIIAGVLVSLLACACIVLSGVFGLGLFASLRGLGDVGEIFDAQPTQTPELIRPTTEPDQEGSGLALQARASAETLETLSETDVPINDLRDLARRLEGRDNIPLVLETTPGSLTPGTRSQFWVSNVDTNESDQITAILEYVTDHVYFWIGEGVDFGESDLERLVEVFEDQIYPTTREFFGSEWSPGIDGDPHLYILYVQNLGLNLLGYFSSSDEQHPLAHEYSNAHEMFLLNADNLDLGDEATYGVLAHEFQHMILWNQDRNEATWMNEGFSELAVLLNGYEVGSDFAYIVDPDIQLNDWPSDSEDTSPHYGAGFLFLTYLLDRLGDEATQALVGNPKNGLEGIDAILAALGVTDSISGNAMSTEDLFLDWVLASYLKDGSISDGRYTYHNYPDAPSAYDTETIRDCPFGPQNRDVSQFGVDYIRIDCPGSHRLLFLGSTQARVVPPNPQSGDYFLWSNKGDESDMTLTREFDFSGHTGSLTLRYWTWYDLEEDYDYVYLTASEDGEHWEILSTPSGTAEDPSGNSYGWGYNGQSVGWVEESVSLTQFNGKKIQLRFEYITDAAVNGEGMLLDDISIPEIGYGADFETDAGGWEASGWVRIQNQLPQSYQLAVIILGDQATVERITVEPDVTAEIELELDDQQSAVLVVSGTTRYTRQKAAYRIEILP
jgi:hypothetical protein